MVDFIGISASIFVNMTMQSGLHGAPHAAPSNYEAYDAFTGRFTTLVLQARDGVNTDVENTPGWPLDMTVERCIWAQNPTLDYRSFGLRSSLGYYCSFQITPLERDAYFTSGFFSHDGEQWHYIGLINEPTFGVAGALPTDRSIQIQPYAESPYTTHTEDHNYSFNSSLTVDGTPYQTVFDTHRLKSYYDQFGKPSLTYENRYDIYRDDVERRKYGKQLDPRRPIEGVD